MQYSFLGKTRSIQIPRVFRKFIEFHFKTKKHRTDDNREDRYFLSIDFFDRREIILARGSIVPREFDSILRPIYASRLEIVNFGKIFFLEKDFDEDKIRSI